MLSSEAWGNIINMKNIFRNFKIKKIELSRLEKYVDFLFSFTFIAMIVFLGLMFYNQFLPIYNFDAFKSPKAISGVKIKDDKLGEIIKDLDERKNTVENGIYIKPIRDPFIGKSR